MQGSDMGTNAPLLTVRYLLESLGDQNMYNGHRFDRPGRNRASRFHHHAYFQPPLGPFDRRPTDHKSGRLAPGLLTHLGSTNGPPGTTILRLGCQAQTPKGLKFKQQIGGSYPEGSDTRDWRSNSKKEGTTLWIRKSEKLNYLLCPSLVYIY